MELFRRDLHIDFVGWSKWALTLSGLVILAGLVSLVVKGGPNYGIDFLGGTMIQVRFQEAPSISKVRQAVLALGLGDTVIQEYGDPREVLIRVEKSDVEAKGVSERVQKALGEAFGAGTFEVRRVEIVGPQVGEDLRRQALLALLYATLGILIYIAFRFEFRFGVAGVLALVHDVLVTLGAFSLTGREFSIPVIAAFLTIIGFSINDTIVVFDRIRENLKFRRREAFSTIVNSSINQTMSRTVLTSGTVVLVVVILFLFGGEVLRDFSFALLVGFISGTYSTIYIAAPILLYWSPQATGMDFLRKKRRA
jgi:preprotein translocase subunit SecF